MGKSTLELSAPGASLPRKSKSGSPVQSNPAGGGEVLDAMLPGRDGENGEGVENWGRRAAKAATAVGDEGERRVAGELLCSNLVGANPTPHTLR
jgi:hypothetical protein